MIELPGDSADYHLLTRGVELSAAVPGLTCEIGLRRGGGTKFIMDAIAANCPHKTHIAIDPYGHIPYEHKEGQVVKLDYTNNMRNEALSNLFKYADEKRVNFLFFNMTDRQFFRHFETGVPIYVREEEETEQMYSFIHFDGPHALEPLQEEVYFFNLKCAAGATWAFDDVTGYYDHDALEQMLFGLGWKLIDKTHHKALYQKQ